MREWEITLEWDWTYDAPTVKFTLESEEIPTKQYISDIVKYNGYSAGCNIAILELIVMKTPE